MDTTLPSAFERWTTLTINVLRLLCGLRPIVKYIVRHRFPHMDEDLAVYLLRTHGERLYHKVARARAVDWNPDFFGDRPTERTWLLQGFLFVGVGRGIYDEHPHSEFPDKCACTLVRDHLELHDDSAWQWLGNLALRADTACIGRRQHLGRLIKELNEVCSCEEIERVVTIIIHSLFAAYAADRETLESLPDDTALCLITLQSVLERYASRAEAIYVLEQILRAQQNAQKNFDRAVKTLHQDAVLHKVWNEHAGRDMRLVVIATKPNPATAKAAWWYQGDWRADMVIQFTIMDDGTPEMVYISTHQQRGFTDLDRLATDLRRMELEADPSQELPTSDSQLAADGPGWNWYYHAVAPALYSGTPTHPKAPRTKLPREVIAILARRYLQLYRLRPKAEPARREEPNESELPVVA